MTPALIYNQSALELIIYDATRPLLLR